MVLQGVAIFGTNTKTDFDSVDVYSRRAGQTKYYSEFEKKGIVDQ